MPEIRRELGPFTTSRFERKAEANARLARSKKSERQAAINAAIDVSLGRPLVGAAGLPSAMAAATAPLNSAAIGTIPGFAASDDEGDGQPSAQSPSEHISTVTAYS